jgi:2-iminoacetate synthase
MFSSFHDEAWSRAARWKMSGAEGASPFGWPAGDASIAAALWNRELGTDGALDNLLIDTARGQRFGRFGGEIYGIVPVYVTSICRERCVYCNYRAANTGLKIDRIRLSDDELRRELEFLADEKGFRVLELVYATDPRMRADTMVRHVRMAREILDARGGGMVALNAEPLEEDEYRALRDAGVELSVVWQETYDRVRYAQVHPGVTKKTDFKYRVDGYERMIRAGIPHFAMAVLSGLSDWRIDWAMLMQHEEYLRNEYGRGATVLGLPRLKAAAGAEPMTWFGLPTDQEFRSALALHHLFAPERLPFVSTRERWDLCVDLATGGGALFTFNCSTIPGGYSLGKSGNQFATGSYDVGEFAGRAEAVGLHPLLTWSFEPERSRKPELRASAV